MKGLLIKPQWEPAIPKERRSFSAFFQPILPRPVTFHWIYPDTIPFGGGDADLEAAVETSCSEGYIPPATLLPRFASFIVEDSTGILGFQKHPDAAAVRRQLQHRPTDYEWMVRNIDLCFFNVDGAWWEVYARDESLLEAVWRHSAGLPDIKIQERPLMRRDNFV